MHTVKWPKSVPILFQLIVKPLATNLAVILLIVNGLDEAATTSCAFVTLDMARSTVQVINIIVTC